MTPEPSRAESPQPSREPPVARRIARRPKVRIKTREEPREGGYQITSRTLGGWAVSLGLHALMLLILGLWFFTPLDEPDRTIQGDLAGDGPDDALSTAFMSDLGLDTPLIMPELSLVEAPIFRPLQPVISVEPDPSVIPPGPKFANPPLPSNPAAPGAGDGFGPAHYGQGTETVQGVKVQVGDPQFTLIWKGRADLDLHVTEPGGTHISWKERKGDQGGRLDVDNRTGPGPENIYWSQGNGPSGVYRWFVSYYGPEPFQQVAGPVRWRVRIKHDGHITERSGTLKAIDDRSPTYSLRIEQDE